MTLATLDCDPGPACPPCAPCLRNCILYFHCVTNLKVPGRRDMPRRHEKKNIQSNFFVKMVFSLSKMGPNVMQHIHKMKVAGI